MFILIKQPGYFLNCAAVMKQKQKMFSPHVSWKVKALKQFAISRLFSDCCLLAGGKWPENPFLSFYSSVSEGYCTVW